MSKRFEKENTNVSRIVQNEQESAVEPAAEWVSRPAVPVQYKAANSSGQELQQEKEQHSSTAEEKYVLASASASATGDGGDKNKSEELPIQGKFHSGLAGNRPIKQYKYAVAPQYNAVPIQRMAEEEEPLQGKMDGTIQRTAEEEEPLQGKMDDAIQRTAEEEEPLQGKMDGAIQRTAEEEEPLQGKMDDAIQRTAEEEEPLQGKMDGTIQRTAEEEEPLQGKMDNAIQRTAEEEEPLQGKMIGAIQKKSEQGQALQGQSATSAKLPDLVQAKMEDAMGADFSGVNFHADSQNATNVGALAYTQGNDVHFAPGHYDPHSTTGQELIGHELAHVVQQRQGRVQATTQAKGVPVNDDHGLEAEADAMGRKAAQMKTAPGTAKSDYANSTMMDPNGTTIQRWEWPWNWGRGGGDEDKKDDGTKELKKVKKSGVQNGTNFSSVVKVPAPLPAVGNMNTVMFIKINFQDCDFDFLSATEKLKDGSEVLKNILSTDKDSLNAWKVAIDKLKKEAPDKLKWDDKAKAKVKVDYQKNIDDVWSSKSTKLHYSLNDPDYEKYKVANTFELKFVNDNKFHHQFTVMKMPDEMGPLIRSFMGGALGGLHDSRTFGGNETRRIPTNYLAEQIGEFDNGSSMVNPSITGKVDNFVATAQKIMKQHEKDATAPKWNVKLIGRATSSGSAAGNKKLSDKRAAAVGSEIKSKLAGVSTTIESDPTGNTKTNEDAKYRRVEVVFRDSNLKDVVQTTMAHETGHLFGYGDEYGDVQTGGGVLPKFSGDEANDTSKAIRDAGMGEEVVKQHRIEQNSNSIMNTGNEVGIGHYSLFLLDLKKVATDEKTGQQVNWQVVKG